MTIRHTRKEIQHPWLLSSPKPRDFLGDRVFRHCTSAFFAGRRSGSSTWPPCSPRNLRTAWRITHAAETSLATASS